MFYCVPADLAQSGLTYKIGVNATLLICCFPHCSPLNSAFVSPLDSTLTVEKVTEVMGEVGDWEGVAGWLDVPKPKLAEIKQQSSTEKEKGCILGEYWVNTTPGASWGRLAKTLYRKGEERAAIMAKQYLPKGMCIVAHLQGYGTRIRHAIPVTRFTQPILILALSSSKSVLGSNLFSPAHMYINTNFLQRRGYMAPWPLPHKMLNSASILQTFSVTCRIALSASRCSYKM